MRMFKVAHTRLHAGEATARCLVAVPSGVPSHVLRFLVGQRLVGFRFAACLFISLAAVVVVFLGADVDAQNHRARTLTNARVSASHVRAYALRQTLYAL